MRKNLKKLLRNAQLREEEILVYLALLKLRGAGAAELISRTSLKTTTFYRILSGLVERGLVEARELNLKQKIFYPLSLKNLIGSVRKQQRELSKLEESLSELDDFLPYMDFDSACEEGVEICEGLENVKRAYLDVPDLAERDLLTFGSVPHLWRLLDFDYDCPEERNFIKKRMANGVYCRIFNDADEEVERLKCNDTLEYRSTKLRERLPCSNNLLLILEDRSLLFVCDHKNPRVVVTKQPELLELQKEQYFSMWETA